MSKCLKSKVWVAALCLCGFVAMPLSAAQRQFSKTWKVDTNVERKMNVSLFSGDSFGFNLTSMQRGTAFDLTDHELVWELRGWSDFTNLYAVSTGDVLVALSGESRFELTSEQTANLPETCLGYVKAVHADGNSVVLAWQRIKVEWADTTGEAQAIEALPSPFATTGEVAAVRGQVSAVSGQVDAVESDVSDLSDRSDAHEGDTANPHAVTATQVGLGSADNTADADKPVSSAQQTALDLKQDASTAATDAELSSHTGTAAAHHARYTDAEAEAALTDALAGKVGTNDFQTLETNAMRLSDFVQGIGAANPHKVDHADESDYADYANVADDAYNLDGRDYLHFAVAADLDAVEGRLDSGVDTVYSGMTPPPAKVGAVWVDTFAPDGVWPNPYYLKFFVKNSWETAMLVSRYDEDADGAVDDAERLGGYGPSYYMPRISSSTLKAGIGIFSNGVGVGRYLTVNDWAHFFSTVNIDDYLTLGGDLRIRGGNVYSRHTSDIGVNEACGVFNDGPAKFNDNRMTVAALQHGDIRDCVATLVAGFDQSIELANSSVISGSQNTMTDIEDSLINAKLSALNDIHYSMISGTNIVATAITNCVIFGTDITISARDGEFYVENMDVLLHLPQAATAPAGLPAGAMWVDSDDDFAVKVKQ